MHIIVTGARGFVGSGLVPLLAAHGHTGFATGRVAPNGLPPGWISAERDRVLSGAIDATRADAVIHLEVKQHAPRPTPADIDEFERANVGRSRAACAHGHARTHLRHRIVFVDESKVRARAEHREQMAQRGGLARCASSDERDLGVARLCEQLGDRILEQSRLQLPGCASNSATASSSSRGSMPASTIRGRIVARWAWGSGGMAIPL